ncbi:hypothetical protein V6Z12_A02G050200 [Gossypium hirsutum]
MLVKWLSFRCRLQILAATIVLTSQEQSVTLKTRIGRCLEALGQILIIKLGF